MHIIFLLSLRAYQIFSPVPLVDFENVILKNDLTTIKIIDGMREINIDPQEVSTLKTVLDTLERYRQPPLNISEIINDFDQEEPLNIDEIIAQGKTSFLVVFSDSPVDNVNTMHVYWSTDKELADSLGVPYPGIYGYNAIEKHHYKLNTSKVTQAVAIVSTPLLGEISTENLRGYDNTEFPKFFIFYMNKLEKHDEYRNVAKKYADRVKIGTIKQSEQTTLKNFGVEDSDLPAVILVQGKKKYRDVALTSEKLDEFVSNFLEGKLKDYKMSGTEPKDNDKRNVKVLTASNLDSYKDKDLLIVFTSPNCGHCTRLKPIIDELGTKVKHPNVVIGNYDSDQNDIPEEFEVYGFPTIFLISDGKQVTFEGERSVKSLIGFIEKNGKSKDIEKTKEDL